VALSAVKAGVETVYVGDFEMATFRHVRTECQCADEEVNRRIVWLDSGAPGGVYVYLSPDDAIGAASQFRRYGILGEGELPGPGDDRISGVTFGCDLPAMIEKMLEAEFSDPPKEIAGWLLVLQRCSKRLGEELLKIQGEEGPPPRF
jgi:hypothetical protein